MCVCVCVQLFRPCCLCVCTVVKAMLCIQLLRQCVSVYSC